MTPPPPRSWRHPLLRRPLRPCCGPVPPPGCSAACGPPLGPWSTRGTSISSGSGDRGSVSPSLVRCKMKTRAVSGRGAGCFCGSGPTSRKCPRGSTSLHTRRQRNTGGGGGCLYILKAVALPGLSISIDTTASQRVIHACSVFPGPGMPIVSVDQIRTIRRRKYTPEE